jgi:hypothetical protein
VDGQNFRDGSFVSGDLSYIDVYNPSEAGLPDGVFQVVHRSSRRPRRVHLG